jgi:hypothetical protein
MADETFHEVSRWLGKERAYQVEKFGLEQDDLHIQEGLVVDGWWWQQLTNYFGRAQTLSLETPCGRQAAAKLTATMVGMLEAVVRVYGELPEPGVPSGEIRERAKSRSLSNRISRDGA